MGKAFPLYKYRLGEVYMNTNYIIMYLACLIVIFILGRLFFLPLKKIVKILLNSILGGVIIYIVNIIGASFNFHIGLNAGTAFFAGILGTPGVILLIILKIVI